MALLTKFALYVVCLTSALSWSICVWAQEGCSRVLKDGIRDKKVTYSTRSTRTYYMNWLCNQTYESKDTRRGGGIAAVWEGVPIEANYSESNFKSFHSSYCQQSEQYNSDDTMTYVMQNIANKDVLDTWLKCMAGRRDEGFGFASSLSKVGPNRYKLVMQYNGVQRNELSGFKSVLSNIEFQSNENLPVKMRKDGTYTVYFKKKNTGLLSTLKIEAEDLLKNRAETTHELPGENNLDNVDHEWEDLIRIFFREPWPNYVQVDWYNNGDPNCLKSGTEYYRPFDLRIEKQSVHNYLFSLRYRVINRNLVYNGACGHRNWVDPGCEGNVTATISTSSGRIDFTDGPSDSNGCSFETQVPQHMLGFVRTQARTPLRNR